MYKMIYMYTACLAMFFFFGWVLRRNNTVKVIRRLSSFTGGGRPQVHLPCHTLDLVITNSKHIPSHINKRMINGMTLYLNIVLIIAEILL